LTFDDRRVCLRRCLFVVAVDALCNSKSSCAKCNAVEAVVESEEAVQAAIHRRRETMLVECLIFYTLHSTALQIAALQVATPQTAALRFAALRFAALRFAA